MRSGISRVGKTKGEMVQNSKEERVKARYEFV